MGNTQPHPSAERIKKLREENNSLKEDAKVIFDCIERFGNEVRLAPTFDVMRQVLDERRQRLNAAITQMEKDVAQVKKYTNDISQLH